MKKHIHKPVAAKKIKSLKLARQAQGTLIKVIEMIESDIYCPEIIQQADSVSGLLKSLRKELLAGHLDTCALNQLKENKSEAVKELLKIYNISD
ncbi:MAG: metal-sensing transcriptional repressor [bacterium]|nr:metal-sensing transcriptional repressor [Candidatus Jorgensenbacteria bacterium]